MKFKKKFFIECARPVHVLLLFLVFFHDHSRTTGLQGKGEGISLTPYTTSTYLTDT